MPKSRRDKRVSLTNVMKKGHDLKNRLSTKIKQYVDEYKHVFIFKYENMRNENLKKLREQLKPESRFLFGKNRVFKIALGRTDDEEVAPELHKLTKYLSGQCGILCTNKSKKEILTWFESCSCYEYARAGFKVDSTIRLNAGPLKQFQNSMEPYLRELGLPTALQNGTIVLLEDFNVCVAGSVLTSHQAKILKFLDYQLAEFKLIPKAVWTKNKGVKILKAASV